MSVQFAPEIEDEQRIAEVWLAEFADALAAGDAAAAAALFIPDGHWRDVLAFTWTIATHSGGAAIEQALQPTLARTRATDLHLPDDRSPPRRVRRAGTDCIETIFEFDRVDRQADAAGAANGGATSRSLAHLGGRSRNRSDRPSCSACRRARRRSAAPGRPTAGRARAQESIARNPGGRNPSFTSCRPSASVYRRLAA